MGGKGRYAAREAIAIYRDVSRGPGAHTSLPGAKICRTGCSQAVHGIAPAGSLEIHPQLLAKQRCRLR